MAHPDSRLWSPFASLPADRVDSVTITRGDGQYVFDEDGRRYLDGIAGLWYCHIGHGRREMADAISAQAGTLAAFQTHGEYDNPPALALAGRLAGLFPLDDPLVFFGSGGGDAIETASKLARAYWQIQGRGSKSVLLSRENAYHGMNGFGTSLVGIAAVRHGSEDGYPVEVIANDDVAALQEVIDRLGADRIAAFVLEPVIGAGGVLPPPEGYLAEVQQVCHRNDILLVCDEVVTGFGRLGTWSGAEFYGLEPDIVAMAKGLTSGYVPLGAALASRRLWGEFERRGEVFRHGYTYAGHPTACAAALANLDILEREGLLQRTTDLAATFGGILSELEEHPAVDEVRHVGLMAGIGIDTVALTEHTGRSDVDWGAQLTRRCREDGVVLRRMFQGDLQVSPALVAEVHDFELIRDVVRGAVDAALAS